MKKKINFDIDRKVEEKIAKIFSKFKPYKKIPNFSIIFKIVEYSFLNV
jgi:hypothetical protein